MNRKTLRENRELQRVARVFSRMLDGLNVPIKLAGKDITSEEAADPCGLLPVFMLEACSVWEAISGRPVLAPIRPDDFTDDEDDGEEGEGGLRNSLLGLCVSDCPKLPISITLLCLAESAQSVMRFTDELTAEAAAQPRTPEEGPRPQIISIDALIQRWAGPLDELRHRPRPTPSGED